jgi:hypothetical protein
MAEDKPQQNPFTIGNPFTIQLEDSEEDTQTTEMEEEPVKEPQDNPEESKQEETPATPATEEADVEERKEVEIEDILDKPVEFDEDIQKSQETVEAALETNDAFFDYQATAEKLIKDGFWEDFEGREDLDIDAETFKQLSSQQDKWKKENIKGAIFSTLDPAEQEYLEYKKMGGDLDSYYQSRSKLNRAENLNIETQEGKVSAIYTYYKNFVGWDDNKIQKFISKLDDGDLQEEAESSIGKVQEHLRGKHQQMLQKQQEAKKQREDAISSYKKNVRTVLKEQKIADTQARQIVKSLTEVNKDTGFTDIDKAYVAFRNDPQRSVLLYQFLTDPQSFIENVSQQKQQEERKKLFFELKKKGNTSEKKDFSFKPSKDRQTRNPFTNK